MIDAHAHLLGRTDVARALELAADAGVTRVILGGTWPADDVAARALAARFPQVSWTSGVHPWWVPADPVDRTRAIEAVAAAFDADEAPLPVALGEIGLDALRGPPRAAQIAALRAQLALARARARIAGKDRGHLCPVQVRNGPEVLRDEINRRPRQWRAAGHASCGVVWQRIDADEPGALALEPIGV